MSIGEIAIKFRRTVVRFSAAYAAAILLAVVLSVLIAGRHYIGTAAGQDLERLALTLLLAVLFFIANRLYFEGATPRLKHGEWVMAIVGAVLLVGYCFWWLDLSVVGLLGYAVTLLVAAIIVLLMPYRAAHAEGFERYVVKLSLSLAATAFYSAILYFGIAAILLTLYELLNVFQQTKVSIEQPFLIALVWLACAFSLPHFLSQFPAAGDGQGDDGLLVFLRPVLLYVVRPLILIYALILYYYLGTILITQVWPEGVVVNLILWFSFVVVALLFFSIPLLEHEKAQSRFRRRLSLLMLPLMGMAFAALAIRISAFGVTEERYYVALLALWVTGVFKYFAFLPKPDGRVLPAVLVLMLVLSLVGPQSAVAVAEYSQNNRLERILLEQGLLRDGRIVPASAPVPWAARVEVSRIIWYFAERERLEALRHLPANFAISDMTPLFGFGLQFEHYNMETERALAFHIMRGLQFAPMPIGDYDYWLRGEEFVQVTGRNRPESSTRENTVLRLVVANHTLQIDLAPAIWAVLDKYPDGQRHAVLSEDMSFVFEDARVAVWIVMNELRGATGRPSGQEPTLHLDGVLFDVFVDVKEKGQ